MVERMDKITEHFYWYEFIDLTKSELTQQDRTKIEWLCKYILEPARQALGSSIIITSAVRSLEENLRAGGHPTSHHLFRGDHFAVDFTIVDRPIEELFEWVREHTQFQYAILYPLSNPRGSRNFVHISGPDSSGVYNKSWVKDLTNS